MPTPVPATSALQTKLLCNGVMITVSTVGEPGWTMDQLADQHDKDIAKAKKDCTPAPKPLRPIVSSWSALPGEMTYSSPAGTQAQHDIDVVKLQEIYPPAV